MKIRIFGSSECPVCHEIHNKLNNQEFITWEWVDANADETQKLCDQFNVDALPHIQFLDDNSKVVWQKSGHTLSFPEVVKKFAEFV